MAHFISDVALIFLNSTKILPNNPQVNITTHVNPYGCRSNSFRYMTISNLADFVVFDDIARQKRCIYAQANALARKFYLCNSSIKTTLFNSYCGSMYTSSLWCHFKKQSLKGITVAYNNSFRIIHNLSPHCSASHMFATNYVKSFNERIRS